MADPRAWVDYGSGPVAVASDLPPHFPDPNADPLAVLSARIVELEEINAAQYAEMKGWERLCNEAQAKLQNRPTMPPAECPQCKNQRGLSVTLKRGRSPVPDPLVASSDALHHCPNCLNELHVLVIGAAA